MTAKKKKTETKEKVVVKTKKSDAKFRFVLAMDKKQAIDLPWSHVRARLQRLFRDQLGGLKPIIDHEVPKTSPSVNYTVEVKDMTDIHGR